MNSLDTLLLSGVCSMLFLSIFWFLPKAPLGTDDDLMTNSGYSYTELLDHLCSHWEDICKSSSLRFEYFPKINGFYLRPM